MKEILAWLIFLGLLGSLDCVKLKKLPYLILLRSFLQCFCMVFYPISSILDQFFCFICIQFLADYKDFSQDLMEYMLPPQLPELPQSQHDLTKVLFPEQCGKIPLTGKPTLPFEGNGAMIQRFLIQADDSELPLMLSAAMNDLRQLHPVSKVNISFHIASIFTGLFCSFHYYS